MDAGLTQHYNYFIFCKFMIPSPDTLCDIQINLKSSCPDSVIEVVSYTK